MSASTSSIKEVKKQVEKWIKEKRYLVAHNQKTPPYQRHNRHDYQTAIAEAGVMKLKGAVRQMFLRERWEGWIAAGQLENVTEAGLMDELLKPLTWAGVTAITGGSSSLGEKATELQPEIGPGGTKYTRNPKTGRLEAHPEESAVQTTEKAASAAAKFTLGGQFAELIEDYGLRLGEVLAGAALILFGLVTIAKGSAPSPAKAAKAALL